MKHLQLLRRAWVNSQFCTPEDGIVTTDDAEAVRLIANGLATDVSADFADPDADAPETAPPAKPGKA
jgi:hypothetical protein